MTAHIGFDAVDARLSLDEVMSHRLAGLLATAGSGAAAKLTGVS